MDQHDQLLAEFARAARSGSKVDDLMQLICHRLHAELVRYNWVGFYLIDPNNSNFLLLGPHAGSFTPHLRIPLSDGLCGAAASSGKTEVVNDVMADPRYLMGSEHTKAEIVVPLLVGGQVAGEFDINSYFKGT